MIWQYITGKNMKVNYTNWGQWLRVKKMPKVKKDALAGCGMSGWKRQAKNLKAKIYMLFT